MDNFDSFGILWEKDCCTEFIDFFALHLLIILNGLTFAFAGGRGLNVELDPCLSNPCLNRGECIQLRFGRYKCECTGTNFYGEKCQKGKRKHRVIVNVEFQESFNYCVLFIWRLIITNLFMSFYTIFPSGILGWKYCLLF